MTPTVWAAEVGKSCVLEVQDGGQLRALVTAQASASQLALCSAGGGRIPSVNKESTQAEKSSALSCPLSPLLGSFLPSLCHQPQSSLRTVSQVWRGVCSDPNLTRLSPTLPTPTCSHPPKSVLGWIHFLLLVAPALLAPNTPPLNNSLRKNAYTLADHIPVRPS